MGIFDNDDFTVGDDPLNPKKKDDPFKIGTSLGQLDDDFLKSFGVSAGGQGSAPLSGATPASSFPIETEIKPIKTAKSSLLPAEVTHKPVPVQPIKIEPLAALKTAAANPSMLDRTMNAFSQYGQHDLQNAEQTAALGMNLMKEVKVNPEKLAEGLNRIAKPALEQSSDTGTLAKRVVNEIKADPVQLGEAVNWTADGDRVQSDSTGRLGKRVIREAKFDASQLKDTLNKMAKADLSDSQSIGMLSKNLANEAQVDTAQLQQMAEKRVSSTKPIMTIRRLSLKRARIWQKRNRSNACSKW